jgi:hypothetical protein
MKLADPEPVVLVAVVLVLVGVTGAGAAAMVKDPTALTAEVLWAIGMSLAHPM